jgi:hypothetical protein
LSSDFTANDFGSTSWEANNDDIGIINELLPMLIGLRVGFGLMVG